eukprot:2749962-Pleurochrysis_carterae.AAC.1
MGLKHPQPCAVISRQHDMRLTLKDTRAGVAASMHNMPQRSILRSSLSMPHVHRADDNAIECHKIDLEYHLEGLKLEFRREEWPSCSVSLWEFVRSYRSFKWSWCVHILRMSFARACPFVVAWECSQRASYSNMIAKSSRKPPVASTSFHACTLCSSLFCTLAAHKQ